MTENGRLSMTQEEVSHPSTASLSNMLLKVYGDLRPVASQLMQREQRGHTLSPTSLVHEAVVRMIRSATPIGSSDPRSLFAAATRVMREVLVDYARRRQAVRRGGGRKRLQFDLVVDYFKEQQLDIELVHEALERLAELSPRQSEIVSLRYFGGLTVPETASMLGISVGTVERDWRIARAWLSHYLRAGDDAG